MAKIIIKTIAEPILKNNVFGFNICFLLFILWQSYRSEIYLK